MKKKVFLFIIILLFVIYLLITTFINNQKFSELKDNFDVNKAEIQFFDTYHHRPVTHFFTENRQLIDALWQLVLTKGSHVEPIKNMDIYFSIVFYKDEEEIVRIHIRKMNDDENCIYRVDFFLGTPGITRNCRDSTGLLERIMSNQF